MTITAEKIQSNWNEIISIINKEISGDRKDKLLNFYKKYEDILHIIPASNKLQYHNCFPGGYIDHVLRVIDAAIDINNVWDKFGGQKTFTREELIFSALNHDLGKMGDGDNGACYIEQEDKWRREKLNELYSFNTSISFMSVPDRGLRLLQKNGIEISDNEFLAIRLHDGLYDEANKSYLLSFSPETKLRTNLPYILHQADLLAARIEYDNEYFGTFDNNQNKIIPTPPHQPKNKKINKSEVSDNKIHDAFSDFFK